MKKDNRTRFAIFASGNGSNAQNIIEYLRGSYSLEVAIVIIDNPDAYVIQRCLHLGVDYKVIPFSKEKGKAIHESEIIEVLKTYHVKWILLAGYMRILSSQFLSSFHDGSLSEARVVNIHPSLLPLYPGLNSYERAFEDKVTEAGVTIHFVDSGIDTGNIILQRKFRTEGLNNIEDFKKTGFENEFLAYREFLEMFNEAGELEHELKN